MDLQKHASSMPKQAKSFLVDICMHAYHYRTTEKALVCLKIQLNWILIMKAYKRIIQSVKQKVDKHERERLINKDDIPQRKKHWLMTILAPIAPLQLTGSCMRGLR